MLICGESILIGILIGEDEFFGGKFVGTVEIFKIFLATDDVELVIVGYGISSRIARTTAEKLRREGVKAGVFRPISLNPFPREALCAVAGGRRIMTIELDAGQFADDVRLNLAKAGLGAEAASVRMVNRMGGEVVSVDDALRVAKEMI